MSDGTELERSRLPMDPRIRQRRIAVRRDEGRRRLRVLVASLALVCVIAAGVAASHSALLDVDHVRVEGAARTATADIVGAAGLDGHRYMLDVKAGSVSRRVEALPWVGEARVERRWPGTIHITVTERTPVAGVVAPSGGLALVDRSGRVLDVTPAGQMPEGLLTLEGLPPAPAPGSALGQEGRAALAVAVALPEQVRPRVASINAASGGIVLQLNGAAHTTVQLGSADQLDAKVLALTTMLSKVDLKGAKVLDLRVPAAPVLTREGAGG